MRLPARRTIFFAVVVFIIGFTVGDLYGGHVTQLVSLVVLLGGGSVAVVTVVVYLIQRLERYFSTPTLVHEGVRVSEKDKTYYLRIKKNPWRSRGS